MKNCKYCKTEIDKDAKICPNCNKKQKKLPTWAIVVIVIVVIGLFASAGSSDDNGKKVKSNTTSTSTNNKTEEKIYNIGDTIAFKKYEITIDAVDTKSQVGTEYVNTSPAEGGIYVCVDFKYKNISDEPISSFSTPSIKLVDSKGTKYSSDISASSYYATEKDPDRKVLSDLNPGITVNDNSVFEINSSLYNQGEWFILINGKTKIKIK